MIGWTRINDYCTLERIHSSEDLGVIIEFDTYELVCKVNRTKVRHIIHVEKNTDDGTTIFSHEIVIVRFIRKIRDKYDYIEDKHIEIAIHNVEVTKKIVEHFNRLLGINK